MGYETAFAIRVKGDLPRAPIPVTLEDLAEELNEVSGGYEFYVHTVVSNSPRSQAPVPFVYCTGMKWYDHEDDLTAFSARHPEVEFHVTGIGEDALFGDIWTQTFKAGTHSPKRYQFPVQEEP